jgi:hypothetical protein
VAVVASVVVTVEAAVVVEDSVVTVAVAAVDEVCFTNPSDYTGNLYEGTKLAAIPAQ